MVTGRCCCLAGNKNRNKLKMKKVSLAAPCPLLMDIASATDEWKLQTR